MRLKLFVKVQDMQMMLKLSMRTLRDSALPPVPEEPDDEWDIRPGFFEEDEEEDTGPMEEDIFSPSRTPERRVERPRPGDGDHERNVRPRVESHLQPESERGSSLVPSRRDSFVPDSYSKWLRFGTTTLVVSIILAITKRTFE